MLEIRGKKERKKRVPSLQGDDSLRLKNVARNACNTRVSRLNSCVKKARPACLSGNGLTFFSETFTR